MRSLFFSKTTLPLYAIFIFFLLIKHDAFNIRISDTNIYFYTAQEILKGKLLYKDVFFTNLPLFPFISVIYGTLVRWRLEYFFAIPIIEIIIISILVFRISYHLSKNILFSYIPVVIYLFSFVVLATSDHETGVFAANIFSLVGYYLFLKRRYGFAGFFLALCVLTKVYFVPIPLAIFTYQYFQDKKDLLRIFSSFSTTLFITLLFFFIQSDGALIKNMLVYSTQRHQGVSKISLIQFFALKDFILFSILLFNIFKIKQKNFFAFFSLFSILLILFYRDIYFLYLNFFAPFIAISFIGFAYAIFKNKDLRLGFVVVLSVSVFLNISAYLSSYQNLQKIKNITTFVNTIKKERPEYLYGINSITPALAYLTNTPLLENIVDTNENRFLTKNLNASDLTNSALKSKTIFVTKSALYPEYRIDELFMSEVFNKNLLNNCKVIYSDFVEFEGPENKLSLVTCHR